MLDCDEFYQLLQKNDIDFFAGVPDSLLKYFCACIFDYSAENKNIIAANEGNAIALSAGYHLATGRTGLVYMQNSGQGNAVNPLTSLVDEDVYSIPMLLLIGWRGEPGVKDEPQHVKQGKITISLLEILGIPHAILPENMAAAEKILGAAIHDVTEQSRPYALIVRKNTFAPYTLKNIPHDTFRLTREEVLQIIIKHSDPDDIFVTTTGKTSREIFEYREALNQEHNRDFLTVGSMGHSSQLAMGIALSRPDKSVYCIDGDGALIMHMGALAVIGSNQLPNFKHIVLNNGSHDSVGGQPTSGFKIDISAIAKACGYKTVLQAVEKSELEEKLKAFRSKNGPAFLEIKINKGARKDLGRPTTTPLENKNAFMQFVQRH